MAPVAYGILALIAGVMVVAVVVGATGGVINGRLRGELSLGAVVVAAAYVLLLMVLESRSTWRFAVFGLLPLMLSFLTGSVTTRLLQTAGLRPVLAMLAALGGALLVGFSYLMLVRFGWLELTDPGTAWVALAAFAALSVLSIWKRMRTAR
jgi:hypothetical protein